MLAVLACAALISAAMALPATRDAEKSTRQEAAAGLNLPSPFVCAIRQAATDAQGQSLLDQLVQNATEALEAEEPAGNGGPTQEDAALEHKAQALAAETGEDIESAQAAVEAAAAVAQEAESASAEPEAAPEPAAGTEAVPAEDLATSEPAVAPAPREPGIGSGLVVCAIERGRMPRVLFNIDGTAEPVPFGRGRRSRCCGTRATARRASTWARSRSRACCPRARACG